MQLHDVILEDAQLARFCRKHHIRRLALFGSILRADFQPDSDIDVLVEFEPGQTPGLGFFAIQDELSELLGHPVDLNTPDCIKRIYPQVMRQARVQFERTN